MQNMLLSAIGHMAKTVEKNHGEQEKRASTIIQFKRHSKREFYSIIQSVYLNDWNSNTTKFYNLMTFFESLTFFPVSISVVCLPLYGHFLEIEIYCRKP